MKQGLSPQLAIPKHDHGGGTPLGCLRHSVLLLLTTNDTLEISQASKVRTKFAKSQTGRWLLATNNKSFSFFSAVDNCRMLICGFAAASDGTLSPGYYASISSTSSASFFPRPPAAQSRSRSLALSLAISLE